MTVRTSLVSALLLSAAFIVPVAAGEPGTAPAGTTATSPAPTPGTTTTAPASTETPPTDVTASGTATPAQPTTAATPAPTGTASTEIETTTTIAAAPAPATASTTASSTAAAAPVTAQAGATVKGAGGVTLGTVASSDAQGNVQLATDGGNVALAPGLVKNVNGELQASAISRKDLMAMAATQRGDQEAAQQASTRRGLRYRAGPPRVQTSAPAPAPAEQAEQPAAPMTSDQPAPATPTTPSGDSGETQAPGTEAQPGTEPQ